MEDLGLLLGILAIIFIVLGILFIVTIVAQWKLFTKAGEAGWKSIVPLYNSYTLIEIAFSKTKNWLFIAPMLSFALGLGDGLFNINGAIVGAILIASSLVNIYVGIEFVKRYASTGMAIGSLFVPFIIYPIIAFSDKYEYTPYTQEQDLLS